MRPWAATYRFVDLSFELPPKPLLCARVSRKARSLGRIGSVSAKRDANVCSYESNVGSWFGEISLTLCSRPVAFTSNVGIKIFPTICDRYRESKRAVYESQSGCLLLQFVLVSSEFCYPWSSLGEQTNIKRSRVKNRLIRGFVSSRSRRVVQVQKPYFEIFKETNLWR